MIRIKDFAVPLKEERPLEETVADFLEIERAKIARVDIEKKAIDARRHKGAPLLFVYQLKVKLNLPAKQISSLIRKKKNVFFVHEEEAEPILPSKSSSSLPLRPIVVGFGPAGMFAALCLARLGVTPLVLERGARMDERKEAVETFWQTGRFTANANVAFGEGGAGTFSDGKLTARSKDPLMGKILENLIAFGAPEEIRYLSHPHVGTDRLQTVVQNLRREIEKLGGEVRFKAHVENMELKDGKIRALIVNGERIPADRVFLGIGHSARDTYRMLNRIGAELAPKAFAMGVRIEHPQSFIDSAQYADDAGNPKLPAADYFLTYQDKVTGRGVYSFCMCPGGQVVAATSSSETVVTNGMSFYARDSGVANAALLVQVTPKDFGDALQGIAFQEKWERLAFRLGGEDYSAPVSGVGDFLEKKRGSEEFMVTPSYRPGCKLANLWDCLPDFVAESLVHGLLAFDQKIPGFAAPHVPLTGVETRSSSPCRIVRDADTRESVNIEGLYPIGEGAGYAGGIMSSALDGIKSVLAFARKEKLA